MEKLVPISYPDEIKRLVGRHLLFKIDRALINPSRGGTVYSINMISGNEVKIEQLKTTAGSDSDSPGSPGNDDVQTPQETPSKRVLDDDLFTPDVATSTRASSNKKLKGTKIEKTRVCLLSRALS